jgi:hypothetical protein
MIIIKYVIAVWIIFTLLLADNLSCMEKKQDFITIQSNKLTELANRLEERDVPQEWFWQQVQRENFQFYEKMDELFTNLIEHRYSRGEIDLDDYKNHFNVQRRAETGKRFIKEHQHLLDSVQARNGIDYELIVAILGMETNFAQQRNRGNYYVFDALVSQYLLIPRRESFAVNQLASLYNFIEKTELDVDYFVGSFAGASGWAQFIPTSLDSFFISADGNNRNIDIFSIEDTLVSIENYLLKHGLKKATMSSESHLHRAIFAYNRSEAYVQAVLHLYREMK